MRQPCSANKLTEVTPPRLSSVAVSVAFPSRFRYRFPFPIFLSICSFNLTHLQLLTTGAHGEEKSVDKPLLGCNTSYPPSSTSGSCSLKSLGRRHAQIPGTLTPSCQTYGKILTTRNGTVSDARPLRLVLLLCALIASAPRSALRLRPRTRLVPRRHRMACMPCNHARHVHPR